MISVFFAKQRSSRESSFSWTECSVSTTYWLVARYQVLHFLSQTLFSERQRARRKKATEINNKERDRLGVEEREIMDSTEARRRSFSCTRPFFASPPSPHPSIYLPSTHPSPLSPLSPCRAGPAFHLLSVPARSSPVPPPLAFTIQLKATSPFLLPLLFLPLLLLLLLLLISFFSCAWMSTAERPCTPCRDAVMTHTYRAHRWCKHTLTHKYAECVCKRAKGEGHNTLTHTTIFFFSYPHFDVVNGKQGWWG